MGLKAENEDGEAKVENISVNDRKPGTCAEFAVRDHAAENCGIAPIMVWVLRGAEKSVFIGWRKMTNKRHAMPTMRMVNVASSAAPLAKVIRSISVYPECFLLCMTRTD